MGGPDLPPPGRPPPPPPGPRPPPGLPRPPAPPPPGRLPPPGPRSFLRSCMSDSIEKLPSRVPSLPFAPPPEGRLGPRRPPPPRSSVLNSCFMLWGMRSTTK
ncbi:MAG: hypothetical protein E6J62_07330 [Deltaproteobacteria bacterium]|nr:MAG: hypothetical protein E6J62_07330 [Deltaproteobacteria bacterium]